MIKNFKLSPSIWFATILLTLLNLAAFAHFGVIQNQIIVAGIACFLFQTFIIALIAFPNFYYLKLKDHLNAEIAQTHALGIQQDRRDRQILEATKSNFYQLTQNIESWLSAAATMQNELISDELAQSTEQLAKESRSLFEKLDASQAKKFDELETAHSEAIRSLSAEHDKSIGELKTQQEQSLGLLAERLSAGLESSSSLQRELTNTVVKTQESNIEVLSQSFKSDLESTSSYLVDQVNSVLNKQVGGLSELAKLLENNLNDLRTYHEGSFKSITERQDTAAQSILSQQEEIGSRILNRYEEVTETLADQRQTLQLQVSELSEIFNRVSEKNTAATNELFSAHSAQTSEIAQKVEKDLDRLTSDLPARIEHCYERIDALLSLHQVIKIAKPLPIMHDWRVSSDYAAALVKTILDSDGGTVIDVGSGVSTIVMGYAAKKKGNTRIVSLEHSEEYFKKSTKLIEDHGLENYCEVILCPLKEFIIDGAKWLWYDIDDLDLDSVMMVSVDGPPGVTQKLARYPAVPMLKEYINEKTIVFLDDANRSDEAEIAKRWRSEFELELEKVESHKGYFRLKKLEQL